MIYIWRLLRRPPRHETHDAELLAPSLALWACKPNDTSPKRKREEQPYEQRRRGSILVVELMLVVPLVLVLILGTIEWALWLTAQQKLSVASRDGARVAATGGTLEEVEKAVSLQLAPVPWLWSRSR